MSFDLFLIFFFLHATFSNSVFQTKIQSFYTKQLRSTYLTSELSLNIASRKCRRKKPRWATTIFRLRPQCYLLTHCQWIVVGVQIEQNPLPGHLMRNFLLIFVLLVGYPRVFFSEGLAFFTDVELPWSRSSESSPNSSVRALNHAISSSRRRHTFVGYFPLAAALSARTASLTCWRWCAPTRILPGESGTIDLHFTRVRAEGRCPPRPAHRPAFSCCRSRCRCKYRHVAQHSQWSEIPSLAF